MWLEGSGAIPPKIEDQLFEAGCDDALVGTIHGRPFLEFDRDADSLLDAVTSALKDVRKAGAEVDRIGLYDFVTASEIARRTNRTRASVSQLISGQRGPGGFPSPLELAGHSPLWLWHDVEAWFASYTDKPQPEAFEVELRKIDTVYQVLRCIPDQAEREEILNRLASV